MAKKLSCVSCGSLKRFPHTFTTLTCLINKHPLISEQGRILRKFPNRADPNCYACRPAILGSQYSVRLSNQFLVSICRALSLPAYISSF